MIDSRGPVLYSEKSYGIRWRFEEGSSANRTCLSFLFPDLPEEEGFDGLGFVSLDPAMLCVYDNGMEMRVVCRKDEDEDGDEEEDEEDYEDEDEQFERE